MFYAHKKKVHILYKMLGLLEQIITDRNTKPNYQITNSANHPLTVMWIAMHQPFEKNCHLQREGTQTVSDATERIQWIFSGAVTERFELVG